MFPCLSYDPMSHATIPIDTSTDLDSKSDRSLLWLARTAKSPEQRRLATEILRERLADMAFGRFGDERAV